MKTFKNNVTLYDEVCPMCNLYTKALIKSGMLDVNGRAAYQQTPIAIKPYINASRAVNEIALINTKTGQVTYGV